MRLSKVFITQYKSIRNLEIDVYRNNSFLVPILGRNNVGKSNMLEAINIFNYVKWQLESETQTDFTVHEELKNTSFSCYKYIGLDFMVNYQFRTEVFVFPTQITKDYLSCGSVNLDVSDHKIRCYLSVGCIEGINYIIQNYVRVIYREAAKLQGTIAENSKAIIRSWLALNSFEQVNFTQLANAEMVLKQNQDQLKRALAQLHDPKALGDLTHQITGDLPVDISDALKNCVLALMSWMHHQSKVLGQLRFLKIFYLNDNLQDLTNLLIVNANAYDEKPYLGVILQLLDKSRNEFIGNLQELIANQNLDLQQLNSYFAKNYKIDFLNNIFNYDDDKELNNHPEIFGIRASWDRNQPGETIKIDLVSTTPNATYEAQLANRSIGFIKQIFMSLLIYWAYNHHHKEDCVVLLFDDPDTSLHVDSQNWLLRQFNDLVRQQDNLNIFYTTHSPFMFDYKGFSHAYGVYKRNDVTQVRFLLAIMNGEKQDDLQSYWMGSTMSLMNLIGARSFWFNISSSETKVLLVEGAYDYLYLKYFASILQIDLHNVNIMWSGGAPKIQVLANFLEGFNIPFKVMCDNDFGGVSGARDLDKLLMAHDITHLYADLKKTDVESLFAEPGLIDGTPEKKEALKEIVRSDIYHNTHIWSPQTLENFRIMINNIINAMYNEKSEN